jgi:transcriptional regulator with PAS, ATPase and Fis domain
MQAKLLRVLENSKVRRLGGSEEISVDVRVLAATNRPIEESVKNKLLREDLFFRLNVFNINLPPLRHRWQDIPSLADALIRVLNKRNDTRVTELDPEVKGLFMNYGWPGNVRELRNILERAVIIAREGSVMLQHLPPTFHVPAEMPMLVPAPTKGDDSFLPAIDPGKRLQEVEEAYIRFTLKQANNNRARTADILGISLRTLYKRLAEMAAAEKNTNNAMVAGVPK